MVLRKLSWPLMSLCHEDVSLACLISFSFFLFCKMFNIATSALIPCQVYVHDKFYCKSTVYTLFFHFPFALVLWISNLTNPLSVLLNIHAGKDITIYKKWDLSIDIRMILLFKKINMYIVIWLLLFRAFSD